MHVVCSGRDSGRGFSDESEGAVGLLGRVGDMGAPLEIFREENIKVGAVDVNSLPSHGPPSSSANSTSPTQSFGAEHCCT